MYVSSGCEDNEDMPATFLSYEKECVVALVTEALEMLSISDSASATSLSFGIRKSNRSATTFL